MEKDIEKLGEIYQTRYVAASDLAEFVEEHRLKAPSKKDYRRQAAKLLLGGKWRELKEHQRVNRQLHQYLHRREQLNQHFIKKEQKRSYRVEGNELDPQQIAAVVACEDAELILAPAGSGKTASLLAKLDYLTSTLKIPARDILVIAFTNKVVAELKERVWQTEIEIRTFHSLGNKIIKASGCGKQLITEEETRKFFHHKMQQLMQDHKYAEKYEKYLNSEEANDAAEAFWNLITRRRESPNEGAETLEELLISVLGLQKSERVNLAELKRRLEAIPNQPSRARTLQFYELYRPMAEAYEQHLASTRRYDFADMLNLATDMVEAMPSGSFDYQYVLVDEAQDLSTAKILLLKAILAKCKKVKLFAVGDDWQSIYRFAGSNLRVLDDFEKIFGRVTYRGLIELTYRFGQPTARVSNKFIQKNPYQSRKRVAPHVKRRTPIEVKLNLTADESAPPDYVAVDQKLQELYQLYGDKLFHKKIQIISRYNRDVFRLVDEDTGRYQHARLTSADEASAEFEWEITKASRNLKIPFCSMHKAKGITRDIILIINANSGNHGTPATRAVDPVAEVLLTKLDAYPHAEERRLWYVAITRAKERTIIISDAQRISSFVFEVCPKLSGAGVKVCPKCHRGIMKEKRRKDGKIYYACSNQSGDCRHTEI